MISRQPCHRFCPWAVAFLQAWAWTALAARDFSPNYVGPESCPEDSSVEGYRNTTTLTNDMFLMSQDVADGEAEHKDEYVFTLCPRTVFDLGTDLNNENDQKETPIIPFFDNTTFLCGKDGSIENQCLLKGGFYQVIFDDDFWWLNNVTFSGVTFQQNEHISVLGFGHPETDIKFTNCRWKENFDGEYLVAIYWDKFIRAGFEPSNRYTRRIREFSKKTYSHVGPVQRRNLENYFSWSHHFPKGARDLQGEDAMYARFTQCEFLDNAVEKAGILNEGGSLELFGCSFQLNRALVSHFPVQFVWWQAEICSCFD
uniref:Uncharacterized protein n=1 Tax=Odontella aurita TaxID=265563 RepID=A0A7S4NFE4_9STRA|mmetsp:Transcript_62895/g.185765  ORF Transcript_62895/g.185765 Transcript_62895/m.185765 type:complete len:313 (+) Transcript_62895:218-1156(+)